MGRFGGGLGGAGGISGLQGMMGGILDREGGFEGDLGLYGKYIQSLFIDISIRYFMSINR